MPPHPALGTARLPGGVELPYATQGAGEPVLVLLHAVGDSWRTFDPLLERLPHTVRVIAPNQRGHGGASCPAHGYRPEDFAADLRAFLDLVGVERAVLVAASSAGFTTRRFAARWPERVRGLVFLGSPALLCDKPGLAEIRAWVDALADPLDPAELRAMIDSLVSRPLPDGFAELMVAEGLRAPARVWRETFHGLLAETAVDRLDRLTAPVLVLRGEQDPLLPLDDQQRLAAAFPHASLRTYADTGHVVHWDAPARVAADLTQFVPL